MAARERGLSKVGPTLSCKNRDKAVIMKPPITNTPEEDSAKSLQSCLTLCDPVDYSPPGSSVHRILQARILGSSQLRVRTHVSHISCISRQVLYHWHHLGSPNEDKNMKACKCSPSVVSDSL